MANGKENVHSQLISSSNYLGPANHGSSLDTGVQKTIAVVLQIA